MKENNVEKGSLKAGNKNRNRNLKAGNNISTKTVVFVPNTKGGMLVRKLRERENILGGLTGFRVKFQEAGGSKLASLFSTDLSKGAHCGRSPCPPCDTNEAGKRPNCRSRNVIYESACTTCNPPVNSSSYIQHSTRLENIEHNQQLRRSGQEYKLEKQVCQSMKEAANI